MQGEGGGTSGLSEMVKACVSIVIQVRENEDLAEAVAGKGEGGRGALERLRIEIWQLVNLIQEKEPKCQGNQQALDLSNKWGSWRENV